MFDGESLPRIIVELALAVNPANDAQATSYLTLDNPATPLDTGTLADDSIWTEVTTDVESLSIRRGRSRELDDIEPGTCTIVLENHHGYYDPTNTASPYYAVDDSNIRPMVQVQVRAEWNGVTYPLFRGYTTDFAFDFGNHPTVTLTVSDALFLMAQAMLAEIAEAYSGELTSARIARLLDALSWPATLRALDTGKTTMPATTLGSNVLDLAQAATKAENGMLFADPEGVITFYNRHRVYTQADSVTPQATFSDSVSAADEAEYLDLSVEYSVDSIANDIHAMREGGIEQTAMDADSVDRYGSRDFKGQSGITDLQLTTDAEVLNFAQWLLGRYKDPDLRVTAVAVDVASQPTAAEKVLGIGLLDRITVERDYGGNAFTRDLLVQGVNVDIARTGGTPVMRFTFSTVGPDRMAPFVLDQSALDAGQLAY